MDKPPKYKQITCDGPLCSPFKYGRFASDDILGSVNCLDIIEGEDITKYGWEYRYMYNDRDMVLCPECQKELAKG